MSYISSAFVLYTIHLLQLSLQFFSFGVVGGVGGGVGGCGGSGVLDAGSEPGPPYFCINSSIAICR